MIYKMAGYIPINPDPLDLEELTWMFEGSSDASDANVKSLIAAIYNTVSTKWIKPSDIVSEKPKTSDEELTEDQLIGLASSMGICTYG